MQKLFAKISPESHKGPYTKKKRQLSVEKKTRIVKKKKQTQRNTGEENDI